ncbi:forkhead box, sub-group O isoform X1 [Leptinotarsa decemlineata]|uniref:Forkhead box protein O n=1 Tax=Leptinotarsa decemlineata TaxID=7539 RepID=A0A0M4MEY6_LEPDE|nr:forkhead box protein O-like [Leptinotarsa decemlineata]ALE20548.1 foxo [Leptinotarsa decemlineata]
MNGQYGAWPVQKMNLDIMEPLAEHDGFEPQTRARSNTWPLPRPENYVEPGDEAGNKCSGLPVPVPAATVPTKKNSSRRNAWGNLSYADLITQAIKTSPDQRLTLSQIYEWMVQNVPYFKDKGDSNSSAGWKNSIRHNLSLHNRFMRVQNEGTGKSSWWMINPDAKPGKSVRRRAASMETSKFEKKRGRAKKKVENIRNGLPDTTPSPSSSVSEGLDLFPESPIHSGGFQLSPDFRPRASSNTSSCGRLSPIPSVGVEPDWGNPGQYSSSNFSPEMVSTGNYSPDQLAGNLQQGMKLEPADAYLGYINGQTPQPPPPPYTAPYEQFPGCRDLNALHAASPYGLTQCPVHRIQSCACMQPIKVESMSPAGMSPSYPHSEPSPDPLGSQYMINRMPRPPSSSPPLTPRPSLGPPSTMMGQLMGALNNSAILDDLNINVESLQGGFECNVEELIKHELNMEGSLDFNFPNQQQGVVPAQTESHSVMTNTQPSAPPPSYSTTATTPSWVH